MDRSSIVSHIQSACHRVTSTWAGRLALAYVLYRAYNASWLKNDLRGRTVLLTGAAGGIGAQIAEQLARRGCTLVMWDVNRRVFLGNMGDLSLVAHAHTHTHIHTHKRT